MSWSIHAGVEGKGVIVTGAAGGIGRAVAEAFATAGARVMAVDLDRAAVEEVVAGLPGRGHIPVAVDLADLKVHPVLIARAQEELGPLDVLAHLAAVLRRQMNLDEVTEEDWDFQHAVNLKASFFLSRAAARAMREQGLGGRIILCSSIAWWTGGEEGSVVYAASKGGVVTLARGLARAYGPDGITVNVVAPGGVLETAMGQQGVTPEMRERVLGSIPLRRWAQPHEIAGVFVFLASDHATFITGATINVTGGWLVY